MPGPLVPTELRRVRLDGGDLDAVPRAPAVIAFEDDDGHTLAMAASADARRLIRARCERQQATHEPGAPSATPGPSAVAVWPVGSSFEADLVFLEIARARLPLLHAALADRYQPWFVHCNPAARYPRWIKTARPGRSPGHSGVWIGPLPDKNAAGRLIDMLESGFDLCRYHHVLTQTPNGTACAYKEMGRCASPCDGTVPLESYHAQIARSIDFVTSNIAAHLDATAEQMRVAGDALDFEGALAMKRHLDDLSGAGKPAFRLVDRLERFRFLAIQRGHERGTITAFLVEAGAVTRLCTDGTVTDAADRLSKDLLEAATAGQPCSIPAAELDLPRLGLVCWHLFRPPAAARGAFVRLPQDDARAVRHAIDRAARVTTSVEEDRYEEGLPQGPD